MSKESARETLYLIDETALLASWKLRFRLERWHIPLRLQTTILFLLLAAIAYLPIPANSMLPSEVLVGHSISMLDNILVGAALLIVLSVIELALFDRVRVWSGMTDSQVAKSDYTGNSRQWLHLSIAVGFGMVMSVFGIYHKCQSNFESLPPAIARFYLS